ncbi:MAG: hypothetical protein JJU11_02695 [Candidatus Sumerlaeia bacterium]|nr:hypothetical protein [Candidatus Sumerlaeia bacterium]
MRTALLLASIPLLLTSLVLVGCRSKPELDDPSTYSVIIGEQDLYTDPVNFRDDIGLHVRAVRNTLVLSWRNNRAEEISVRPEDLALIAGPDRETDVFPFTMANVNLSRFRPLLLQPGQSGVMVAEMRISSPLQGSRLAYFNRRQDLMIRADVE